MDGAITDTGTRKARRRAEPNDPAAVQAIANLPTHDDIARRAYELYLERGGQDGADVDDWLRAEQELAISRQSTRPFES